MPIELSPIIPLIQKLDVPSRNNCMGVGAAIKRQQRIGQWTRDLVVTTLDRIMLYPLPVLQLTGKAIRDMDIPPILATHHPDVVAMIYEDLDAVAWCIRLDGPGLPLLQDDFFQRYAKVAVLV